MITIFLGTYNRIETLERTIRSFERFKTPHEIVIVDNGTDNQVALDLLEEIAKRPEVKKVYNLPKIYTMDELTKNYNVALGDDYPKNKSDWYAVTDADVCFEGTDPGALCAYVAVAQHTGYAAGPHLRVNRYLPAGYPLRSRVLVCESRLLYRQSMLWLNQIPYSCWSTDTTFHLFPPTRTHNRLRMTVARVAPPFDAKHLDWYVDVHNPTVENDVYINGKEPIGSWGRTWIAAFWQNALVYPWMAFDILNSEPRNQHDDLCNTSFILSWCYQYGFGVDQDTKKSIEELTRAVPERFDVWWRHVEDWSKMIYKNDFTSLGW